LFNKFLFVGLCTKHPGYIEGKEYRIIHCPSLHPSTRLVQAVELVGDAPQIVYSGTRPA
jgi:hypothetical protein